MKRLVTALLALSMALSLAACGGSSSSSSSSSSAPAASGSAAPAASSSAPAAAESTDSDAAYIQGNGVLKIGYTYFEPMNYNDENGQLTGFDTEYAKRVCEELGLTPEFIEINWDTKEIELNSKNIDCIWNGTTVTEERKENMLFGDPYVVNAQVIVIRKADAEKYTDLASLAGARMVAEVGSSGEDVIETDEILSQNEYNAMGKQIDCFLEVKSNQADAAVIDMTMAMTYCQDGTDYADLYMIPDLRLAEEQNAIAFRKGSDFAAVVNEVTEQLKEEGFMQELADKYQLTLWS